LRRCSCALRAHRRKRGAAKRASSPRRSECPRQYKPHPVNAFTTPAHKGSLWYVVIAVTFSKPGHYYLKKIRIDYTTDGHEGWQ
jgi:hypothetical protein